MDKASKYLFDIDFAITLIENFLSGIQSFSVYQDDIKTQSAVERQLAIIGEAINKLLQEDPTITLSHAKQIIDLRNRIIHSYDNIDTTIVWTILNKYLPLLKQEIKDLL